MNDSSPDARFPRNAKLCASILLVTAAACGEGADANTPGPPVADLTTVPTPAAEFSGEPNLTVGPDGPYLSWLERSGPGRHALRFARWTGDGWGEPGTVMDREGLFVNWADFPALAVADDGSLLAHWLEKSGPGTYAYDVRMALSRDGGESWSDDVIPHRDGVEAEHGFVSLVPLGDRFGAVWLDGRETVEGDPMTLRFTTIGTDGSLGPEAVLDASVCDCCQTSMARTADGLVVAYRDRTEGEVRDIRVARRVDGEWTDGITVHHDGWVIPGCPVNGPSIDAAGQRVAVAWFTGAPLQPDAERDDIRKAGEQGRVLAAFSDDGGATFGDPVRVDDGAAMGRVAVELLSDDTALVTWLERVEGAAEVRVRRVTEDGVGPGLAVTGTAAQRASGFPRTAVWNGRVLFAWTEPADAPRIRTSIATLPGSGR